MHVINGNCVTMLFPFYKKLSMVITSLHKKIERKKWYSQNGGSKDANINRYIF